MNIKVFTDGGSRGNPGEAGIGVYIEDDDKELASIGKRIGVQTNNVAEYQAIIEAFDWLIKNKYNIEGATINFYMDSELAYSQLSGLYKVKNEKIREMIFEIRQREAELGIDVNYNHVRRESNKKADTMVNMALDNKL